MVGAAFVNEEFRLFHKMCKEGNAERVTEAFKSKSISLVMLDTRSPVTGRTAVHEACASGHRHTVEQLLKIGVDTQKKTYLGGDTALHLAVSSGERSLVFLLLQHGCDPNALNMFGGTSFHYAGNEPAIAKLLLRYGGRVSIPDRSGKTPLDYMHEKCPDNQVLHRLMKEAFDAEEIERVELAYAHIKEEENRACARMREIKMTRENEKARGVVLDYKTWRGVS